MLTVHPPALPPLTPTHVSSDVLVAVLQSSTLAVVPTAHSPISVSFTLSHWLHCITLVYSLAALPKCFLFDSILSSIPIKQHIFDYIEYIKAATIQQ